MGGRFAGTLWSGDSCLGPDGQSRPPGRPNAGDQFEPGDSVAEPDVCVEIQRGASMPGRKVNAEEQTGVRPLRRKLSWETVVKAAEKVRGAPWDEWRERRGDWGRDAVMRGTVRHGGMRLTEVVGAVTGIQYQPAAQAVKRFAASLEKDAARRKFVLELRRQLSIF